jgi:hypothetical protein
MMRKALFAIVGVMAFIGLLFYMTMGQKRQRVEVCMTYQGRQNCARASGETREQAQRTAITNACALIASGVTDSLACERGTPVSINWIQ